MIVDGKTSVVTGGAGGIGKGFAEKLLARGGRVALLDRDPQRIDAAVEALQTGDDPLVGIVADVTDEASMRSARLAVESRWGSPDLLVNAAGLLIRGVPVVDFTPEAWRALFDVNLVGIANSVRAFLPGMLARGLPGHIVNVASLSGFLVVNRRIGGYSAAKFAVVGYSEALAAELEGTQVGLSILAPGLVSTDFYVTSAERTNGLNLPGRLVETPDDIRSAMKPAEVAEIALSGVERGQIYIMTHRGLGETLADRHTAVMRGLPEYNLPERSF